MSSITEFFAELQRRSVVRAAVIHVLVFWLLIQVADVVLPYIGIVEEPVRWAVVAGVGLFPVTLIIAWIYEHPWTKFTRGRVATDIILVILIAAGASTWVLRNLPQVVHMKTSIVVLPFEHQGVEDGESISRVIAVGVNSLLMQSRSIEARDTESALSPLLNELDAPAIAARLDVQHVLGGSITRSGKSLRISVNLMDDMGLQIWEQIIEDELDNLTRIQENIATEIQQLLGAGEDAVAVAEIAAKRCWMPDDPEAIEKYYTARYYTELRTDSDDARTKLREAISIFRELIEEYPEFAEAYSGLAWALGYQTLYDRRNAVADWLGDAQVLAGSALEYCPTLGEAMHLLPNEYDHDNQWIGQYRQRVAFVEMEPHRTANRQRLARHFRVTGLVDRSIAAARRNYELNPLSVRTIKEYAAALQDAGRLEEAILMYDRAAELGSTSYNFARQAQLLQSCETDDLNCFIDNLPPGFDPLKDSFRQIYAVPANAEEAARAIDTAKTLLDKAPFLVNWLSGSSCRFEHLTPLFFELIDIARERDLMSNVWHWPNVWNPRCANVWGDPRFTDIVEEFGFVEYWREVGWPEACRPDGESFTCGDPAASTSTD